jgi:hypothetical protein
VGIRDLADPVRPIHSGILTRKCELPSPAAADFVALLRETVI